MTRPRKSTLRSRSAVSELSTEVHRLRLQALNLPFSGFRLQLIRALQPTSGAQAFSTGPPRARASGRVAKRRGSLRLRRPVPADLPAEDEPATVPEDDPGSAFDAASSLDDILQDQPGSVFTPAQLSAIQATVAESVQAALSSFPGPASRAPEATQPLPQSRVGSASPLGLTRPLDRHLEERILRGEYIDFACLLPDSLTQPQAPELQLRLDASPSLSGSPLSMVRRKKPVVDSFHKWLDAYTTYMLVLVSAFPRRSLELIRYQQIVSTAVTKFKGLAWLAYDEQFRRRAACDSSLSWDSVDLELWTITFSGLAKPHCSVCSSPHHAVDDCPRADPSRKSRRTGPLVCFDFNKPSGCSRRACIYPHVCRRCNSSGHSAPACPDSASVSTSGSKSSSSGRGKR